jgi:hypothetical protein
VFGVLCNKLVHRDVHNLTNTVTSVLPALESRYGPTPKSQYYLGCINPQVVIAGWAGGIGRGMVEGPFEMVKVRRQIVSGWAVQDMFQGFGTTVLRNSFLFSSFVMYMDILKQQVRYSIMLLHCTYFYVLTCHFNFYATILWHNNDDSCNDMTQL